MIFVSWFCLLPVLAAAFRIVPTGILGSSRAQNCRQSESIPNVPKFSPLDGKPIVSHQSSRLPFRRKFFLAASNVESIVGSSNNTNHPHFAPEEVKVFFDKIFAEDSLDVDVLRDPNHFNDPEVCIIHGPELTMRGSFFSNLTEIVGTIVDATEEPPNPRSKPFVALMKGSGGGKTRLVEEVRRRLLTSHSNILPVAITFNSKWSFPLMDKKLWGEIDCVPGMSPSEEAPAKCSMSVVLRILSMVYRQKIGIIREKLESPRFLSMLSGLLTSVERRESLLKGLVMHVIGKAKESCPQIDSFVLLMDETAKMYEEFKDAPTKLFIQEFRQALLNEEIWLNDQPINVGLLITSLRLGPLDERRSSRTVCFLEPRDPDADEVVNDWWGLGWITKLKDHRPVMDMYRVMASVFRRWMRSSEYVLKVLERRCKRAFGLTLQQVSDKLDDAQWRAEKEAEVRNFLVNAADDIIDNSYLNQLNDQRPIPSNQQVFQMIFNQWGALDANSIFLITDNFISNAIKSIVSDDGGEACGTVRHFNVSMFGLYLSAKNRGTNETGFSTAADFVRMVQELNKIKNEILVEDVGSLLEHFDRNYLWFRLKVATAAEKSSISLNELLGTDEDFHGFGPVMLKKGTMDVFYTISIKGTTDQFPVEIAKELMNIQVDEDCPYKIITPHPDCNERFDFALKYYDPKAPGSSRLLFFENKMKFVVETKHQGIRRYQHKALSEAMAMANTRYTRESCLFIYRTTKAVNTTNAKNITVVDIEINDFDGDNVSRKSRMEQETSRIMEKIRLKYPIANCEFQNRTRVLTSTPTVNVTEVDRPMLNRGVKAKENFLGLFSENFQVFLSRLRENLVKMVRYGANSRSSDSRTIISTNTVTVNVTDVDMPLMIHGVKTMRTYFGPFYEFFEICLSRVREKLKKTAYNQANTSSRILDEE